MTRHIAGIRFFPVIPLALAAAVLAATAGNALAQEDADVFQAPRTELGIGMLAGALSVGPIYGPAVGIHIDAGRQMGRVKL